MDVLGLTELGFTETRSKTVERQRQYEEADRRPVS